MGGFGSSMDARRWAIVAVSGVVIVASGVWLMYTSGVIGSHPKAYDPFAGLTPEEKDRVQQQQKEDAKPGKRTSGS